MRTGKWLWVELREVIWLASVAGGLSVLSVGVAVALAFVHLVYSFVPVWSKFNCLSAWSTV